MKGAGGGDDIVVVVVVENDAWVEAGLAGFFHISGEIDTGFWTGYRDGVGAQQEEPDPQHGALVFPGIV